MEETALNIPSDTVIVIGRQFGSGGRSIGKIIARKLGIKYYDSELLSQAAARLGMHPDIFQNHDEKKPSVLRTLIQGLYGIADNFHSVPLNGEIIYQEQSKVIRELCNDGPCVIVGRTADYILRHKPHVLSVFLHSPVEYRAKEIVKRKETQNIEEAVAMAKQKDRSRESYYNFFTGSNSWGKADNYDLSVDTSNLGFEEVADFIINIARSKFKT